MDKRKKRTSINQYLMYIELLEKDAIFRSGTAPRDAEPNYLNNKWKDLAAKLNTCPNGPQLLPEEWKKRLNDWKNSTRCKYRRSISGEKDISMSPLEVKALSLFGKTPVLLRPSQIIEFKSEAKALYEAEKKHQEAKAKDQKRNESNQSLDEEIEGIFIEDEDYSDKESGDEIEIHENKIELVHPTSNGVAPKVAKRRRTMETTVYEIKSFPVKKDTVVAASTQAQQTSAAIESDNSPPESDQPPPLETSSTAIQSQITLDTSALEFQLKRIADIKAAKLQFEIAKYKHNNPGFEYPSDPL